MFRSAVMLFLCAAVCLYDSKPIAAQGWTEHIRVLQGINYFPDYGSLSSCS